MAQDQIRDPLRSSRRPGFDLWVRRIPWRRKRQPTPVFLPGKSHGQRNLRGYSPPGCQESDPTGRLTRTQHRFSLGSVIDQAVVWSRKGEWLLQTKRWSKDNQHKSLLIDHSSATICLFFLIQNNKNARFAFIVCPLMSGYILQDFTSVLKHSSRSASLRRRLQEVGGGGRGERRQGDAHPTSKGPAQLQPCETPPHELIPWQCKLGWHNASGKLLQPTAVGALLLFPSTGKISIGISSCSWGNGILFRGVVGNRTPCLR